MGLVLERCAAAGWCGLEGICAEVRRVSAAGRGFIG